MKFLFIVARLLQVFGMVLCGYALYFGVVMESMSKEFMFLGIGGCLFYLGWAILRVKFK